MKHRIMLLAFGLLVACVTYVPPQVKEPEPLPAAPVRASFNRTWATVIDFFADQAIPVKTLDRSSGYIAAGETGRRQQPRLGRLREDRERSRARRRWARDSSASCVQRARSRRLRLLDSTGGRAVDGGRDGPGRLRIRLAHEGVQRDRVCDDACVGDGSDPRDHAAGSGTVAARWRCRGPFII